MTIDEQIRAGAGIKPDEDAGKVLLSRVEDILLPSKDLIPEEFWLNLLLRQL